MSKLQLMMICVDMSSFVPPSGAILLPRYWKVTNFSISLPPCRLAHKKNNDYKVRIEIIQLESSFDEHCSWEKHGTYIPRWCTSLTGVFALIRHHSFAVT